MKSIYFTPALPKKFPLWNTSIFNTSILNKTHMYGEVKAHIKQCIDMIKEILEIPSDYQVFFVPGSCSGAMLCAFLNFFKEETLIYHSGYFSDQFSVDIERICKKTQHVDFSDDKMQYKNIDIDRFIVYTETTKGLKYSNFDFLPETNATSGITIVDAASAIFLEKMHWNKFDVIAGCGQKILGADGSLGFLIVNQKTLDRLNECQRYIPRLFDISRWGLEILYEGQIMSTPAVLAYIDLFHSLSWVKNNGGINFLQKRSENNWKIITNFMENCDIFEYVIKNHEERALSIACLDLKKWHTDSLEERTNFVNHISQKAAKIFYVYDTANFAAPNWRFWIGPTQEAEDIGEGLNKFVTILRSNLD